MASIFSGYDMDKVEDFEWWFLDNLKQYQVIQEMCIAYAKEAKKKFSLRTLFEILRAGLDLRWRHVTVSLSNDFIPMLQRRLEADRPDLKKYLTPYRANHKKQVTK
jgi:hypothetical protein